MEIHERIIKTVSRKQTVSPILEFVRNERIFLSKESTLTSAILSIFYQDATQSNQTFGELGK